MMTHSNGTQSDDGGVPDLTPHINDPLEHLRNIFKGFCGSNLDLGERPPPVVRVDTISHTSSSVCGYVCMDSHAKELEPCLPCKDETTTPGEQTRGELTRAVQQQGPLLFDEPQSQDPVVEVIDTQVGKPPRRIASTLVGTAVAVIVMICMLHQLGYSSPFSPPSHLVEVPSSQDCANGALPIPLDEDA